MYSNVPANSTGISTLDLRTSLKFFTIELRGAIEKL